MIDLSGRQALVVGAAGGIGRAVAVALARAGADIAVAVRREETLPALVDELGTLGTRVLGHTADATDPDSVGALLRRVHEDWGALSILVTAHGVHDRTPARELDDATFSRILETNVTSVFSVCRAAYPLLRASHGAIVTVASMGSFLALKQASAYTASKGGLAQLTKALAVEWAKDGIRCNAVAPGWIETPLSAPALADQPYRQAILRRTPLGRLGKPDDVAAAVLFLVSDLAAFVTGAIVPVDGGALASV